MFLVLTFLKLLKLVTNYMYIHAQLQWVHKIATLTFHIDPIYNLGYHIFVKYLLSNMIKLFSLPSWLWNEKKNDKKSD